MLHSTKGVVLRSVRYGESSLVVTIYTELLGLQSYLVQGVRTEKKSGAKAGLLQPTTLLDLVVYHQPNKNLQRIKEFRLAYWSIHPHDLIRNSIKIFAVEILSKLIMQPEPQPELFDYVEKFLREADQKEKQDLANAPLRFLLDLADHLGFGIQGEPSVQGSLLDLQNGCFLSPQEMKHLDYAPEQESFWISQLLHHPSIELNRHDRKQIMETLLKYIQYHHPENLNLKSPDILQELLND